jgi:hypothetical protein
MKQPTLEIYDVTEWLPSKDANPTARAIFETHYSYRPYADGRRPRHFVGPGEKMVLLTPNADALFVWRKFISGDGQEGVNCAAFHNDSTALSSNLILTAESLARSRWPGERFYTYVNPKKLRTARKRQKHGEPSAEYCPWPPGRCFLEAGWRRCGLTKHNKLWIFEKITNAGS